MSRRALRRHRSRRVARRRFQRLTRCTGSMGPPREVEVAPSRLRKTNFRSRYWTDDEIEVPVSALRRLASMEPEEPGSPTEAGSRIRRRRR